MHTPWNLKFDKAKLLLVLRHSWVKQQLEGASVFVQYPRRALELHAQEGACLPVHRPPQVMRGVERVLRHQTVQSSEGSGPACNNDSE